MPFSRSAREHLANPHGQFVVQKIASRKANSWIAGRPVRAGAAKKASKVTSEVPQAWFVMLQDEASAGRVLVPLRPFLKFSRRMDRQLKGLEKRLLAEMPQLRHRKAEKEGRRSAE
jgi:hypothetical protein